MPDHGGNLDVACTPFGGRLEDWIDLSTGINRQPYPVGDLPARAGRALPSRAEIKALYEAARSAYGTTAPVLASPAPRPRSSAAAARASRARAHPAPTYNEYAPLLTAAGWQVEDVGDLDALAGADLAVVVNPNNPDGRQHDPAALLALASRVKRLVVDESFADAVPGMSLASEAGAPGSWSCAPSASSMDSPGAARLRARQRGGCRGARRDGRPVAGLGRCDRDRTARVARS